MYELVKVAKNTFFMDCPAKVGIFKISDEEVVLIDSGSDKDAGKKVKNILDTQGWKLKAIYNTHSHADHIGGNQYLQNMTGCKIYAPGVECSFTLYPFLEPTALFGGYAPEELKNKFLMAKNSSAEILTEKDLPDGLEIIELPGHSYDMVGFKTSDDVIFLADSLMSEYTMEKYKIGYTYDIKEYLNTLEKVKGLSAECFVPSHADVTKDIVPLAQMNIDKTLSTAQAIKEILSEPKTFEEILSEVFGMYGLTMTLQQNVLIGSTVKSFLSYLAGKGEVSFFFENNMMKWRIGSNV